MLNHKKRIPLLLAISCMLFSTLGPSLITNAEAANPIDKLSEIQNKIKSRIQEVKESRLRESSITAKINDINKDIEAKENELKQYDRKIAKSRGEMQNLSKEIKQISTKLESRNKYLNERIRALHKRQYGGDALVLMTAADYQDLIRKSKYISLLAYYDKKVIKKYSEDIRKINMRKGTLEVVNDKLKSSKYEVLEKKDALNSDLTEKDKMLGVIQSRRLAQENKLKELQASSKKLQNMVITLKNKKIPESIIGDGFEASKGNMSWPVMGSILSPYGQHLDSELNATVFNNGIEIKAEKGETPKAIAGGRVVYAAKFKGYGNLLIIDHGNGYHSLYGNLSELALKTGELLIAGMDVGIASSSETSHVPALYFEIRHKGKPINPLLWLKKKG